VTHPQISGSSEGAGSKDGRGIAANERLSNTADRSLPSDGSKSFGFEISSQESRTGGKAKSQGRPIYLDMQVSHTEVLGGSSVLIESKATTPVDPRVLDKMLPFFTNQYGNPHSRTHAYGWEAEVAVDVARAVSVAQ
jgi:cysteine desulfurase